MNVHPIPAFSDNYIWAIYEDHANHFYCVDPGQAHPVQQFAQEKGIQLTAILLTHHHHDHIGGVKDLVHAFPSCKVYGPDDSRIPLVTDKVHESQRLSLGSLEFQIIFNPGHTSTHISYFEPSQEWLFCGDTLFSAGCGRVFDGTIEQLHESLHKFSLLPPTTKVFCAHEYTLQNLRFAQHAEPRNQEIQHYIDQITHQSSSCSLPSTIGLELTVNPFLRTKSKELQDFALAHGAKSSDSLDVFKVLREQKNHF